MYKRQIDDIKNIKPIEIYGSTEKGAYFSMNSFLENDKPYNGIYINKNKVIVSDIFETIKLSGKEYYVENLTTIMERKTSKEYICEIDLENMQYMYRCQNVTYNKKIYFIPNTDILVIDYDINNENEQDVNFSIIPTITYRDMLVMKKANYLKFSGRNIDDGILINLSIIDNENLVMKSSGSKFSRIDTYVSNVKHECVNLSLKKDVYIEDLYCPGKFETDLAAKSNKNVKIYISTSNIDIEKYNDYAVENVEKDSNIDDEFIELRKLKNSLKFLEDINVTSMPESMHINTLLSNLNNQNVQHVIDILLLYIKSINGRYICLDRLSDAKNELDKYINTINSIENLAKGSLEYFKLKMWTVEIINKLFNKDENILSKSLKEYIGSCVINIEQILKSDSYEFVSNSEVVSLMYNTLKIYENIYKDPSYSSIANDMTELVVKNFWDDKRRLLKRNADDLESVPCIEMLYSISLSYSVVSRDMQIKLLDTVFRELYTPYGLRICSKTSSYSDGLVYPKYMAYFIDANLKQNGNSYASKKIAYNLVKELFIDIGKYVKDGVIYAYSEKGVSVDSKVLDLYTTSEMIRLYTMFM